MNKIWTRLLSVLSLASVALGGIMLAGASNGASVAVSAEADCESCECQVVIGSRLWELISGSRTDGSEAAASERIYLSPGGNVFGTRIKEAHVSVATPDESGVLAEGDKIISINGTDIYSIKDIKGILSASNGEELKIICQRGKKTLSLSLKPKEVSGEYKLGAVLREGAAGIGTVTYIDPTTGAFGGLGHGICDADSGEVIEMTGGVVTGVVLGGVIKGESGKPGELSGILTDKRLGEIYSNTECGVFGELEQIPKNLNTPLPIAFRNEVKEGEAKIISTLKNGTPMEYKIEISDVNRASSGTKSFKIKVADDTLLAISGGIVRGMSGSPIIQDGKLVGAVTHVMVNDPTRGYGIFIENMLAAAEGQVQPEAA